MFKRTNLHLELLNEKVEINASTYASLNEFRAILEKEEAKDNRIKERINSAVTDDNLHLLSLNAENVFSLKEIKTICARYRLRFLESRFLRYPMPYEAFIKIKEFEKTHDIEIKKFSILAPAEAFKLNKKADPLLFAHLGNDRYYLIHSWGNDLSSLRKYLVFPLRNIYTFFLVILIAAFLVAFVLPQTWILYNESSYSLTYNVRLFLFFVISTGSFAILFYLGITRNKQFNEEEWNSKTI